MADLIPQPEGLPGFVVEHVDDSVQSGSFDSVSYYLLQLYGDRPFCHARVDRYRRIWAGSSGDLRRNWRQELDDELMDHARMFWPHVPDALRRGILRSSVLDYGLNIRDTAQWMAGCAMTDACEGGCLEAFNRAPRPGLSTTWNPGKRVHRRLLSPRFIRSYVRRDTDLERRRATAQYALACWKEGPVGTRDDEEVLADTLAVQGRSTLPEPEYRRELLRWLAQQEGVKVRKIIARDKRRARRKITRAALFADSLLEPGQVGTFAQGGPIMIRGEQLTFAVAASRGLGAVGHGCLDIVVRATGGPLLGSLCFYVKDTPCLDQLAAIALHTGAGTEREILAIGNVIQACSDGADHPFMQERRSGAMAELIRRPPQLPPELAAILPARGVGRAAYDARELAQQRNEQYWDATGRYWCEALASALLGREAAHHVGGVLRFGLVAQGQRA